MNYVSGDKLRTLTDNLYYLEESFNMDIPEVSITGDDVTIFSILPPIEKRIDTIIKVLPEEEL